MEYLVSLIIGYLFGSLPTAYLVLKRSKNIDITKTGTGNVGAMNSFEITNSKMIGILVFIIDALKGILSVILMRIIFPGEFVYPAIALVFAVFSHCFNPWLKFKGGRGLATAAGGAAFLFPFVLVVWTVSWVIIFLKSKDILVANIWANLMSLLIVMSSLDIGIKYSFPQAESISILAFFTTSLLLIIFIKHIDPLKEIIDKKSLIGKGKNHE